MFWGLLRHNLRVVLIQSLLSLVIISFLFDKNKRKKKVAAEGLIHIRSQESRSYVGDVHHTTGPLFQERGRGTGSINFQNLPAPKQEMLAMSTFFRV